MRLPWLVASAIVACSSSDESASRGQIWRAQACEEPHGEIHRVTSTVDAETRLEGAWTLCSGGLAPDAPSDLAGIAMSGGAMHALVRDGEWLTSRGAPRELLFADQGTELHRRFANVTIERTVYGFRVSENGRFLVLDDVDSEARAQFVRALPGDAISGRLPDPEVTLAPAGDASAPAPCEWYGPTLALPSVPALAQRLTGPLRACKGTLRARPDARGLDIFGANAFALVEGEDGVIERSPSWDYVFDVRVRVSETGETGAFFIELSNLSGVWGYSLRVSRDGRIVMMAEIGKPDEPLLLRRE